MAEPTTTTISLGGRIVLPARFRRALNWNVGDEVTLSVEDGCVRISTLETDIREMQELLDRYVPAGLSLADELIRDRRAEAARE